VDLAQPLEHDPALQTAIMGSSGAEDHWCRWINQSFPDFPIIRELCNGSKHFRPRSKIRATHRPGWNSAISYWNNSWWNDNSFYVEVDGVRLISVVELVTGIRDFWRGAVRAVPPAGLIMADQHRRDDML
jgi:hypothetical protein